MLLARFNVVYIAVSGAAAVAGVVGASGVAGVEVTSVNNGYRFGATASQTHYGDPYKAPCETDEVNITITGVGGAVCSSPCKLGKCPSDKPATAAAEPKCALQSSAGKKYCVLQCTPSATATDQRAADSQCGTDASCKAIRCVTCGFAIPETRG